MGLFSGIKNNLKKAEAAVVIQNLLEVEKQSGWDGADFTPSVIANKLVEKAWDSKPQLFDGSVGGIRPHKLSVATYCLAFAIDSLPEDSELRSLCLMPFMRAMGEVAQNGPLYGFNSVDDYLLEPCFSVFQRLSEELDKTYNQLMG